MKCRHCGANLQYTLINLGCAPLSNDYLTKEKMVEPQLYYPLHVKICSECWLVQTIDQAKKEAIFDENYAYFSSTSVSWLKHAEKFSKEIIKKLNLNSSSFVIEIASNDGYLLKNFLDRKIPCVGIEPTRSTAKIAEKMGIKVIKKFFTSKLGKSLQNSKSIADLIIANNVLAHVPDINDFCAGVRLALKEQGTATFEFPHLQEMLRKVQFDTIYHEHFSYLSLISLTKIFKHAKLKIWDVEKISTHGGSLRIYVCHENSKIRVTNSVNKIICEELEFGITKIETYMNFEKKARFIKDKFITKLIKLKNKDKKVVGYGAAAKGNTLINYSGVGVDLLPVIFDGALSKQYKFSPGARIPILPPSRLEEFNPDYIVIFPWNIVSEIKRDIGKILKNKIKFILPYNH